LRKNELENQFKEFFDGIDGMSLIGALQIDWNLRLKKSLSVSLFEKSPRPP
jgi:hypothetical protein